MSSEQKRVVVTGALGMMGRRVVDDLVASGFTVLGIDREAAAHPSGARVVSSDVTDQDAVRDVLTEFAGDEAGLYGVVNCAALIPTAGLWDIDAEAFLKTIQVNTWGTFNVAREGARLMMKNKVGRIVNVASVAGYIGGLVGGVDYAASKSGVMVITKVLARELAGSGITVNTVAPGALESPANDALSEDSRALLLSKIPTQRLGRMSEIVHSIEHLLSEDAGYITGSTIDVNGGVYLR